MGVLSGLEPSSVFTYFEKICSIPHGSGKVEQISDYLVSFARERGLFCIQDELKNVIIVKEATPGYENEPAVILQGHMDMVAVKKPDCDIDMKTEGLRLAVDGDKIYAKDTSLGGDDGIAVAYSLALLDSDTVKHPKLEVIITVDEEVGMDGATGIDLSCITGNRMINLDSEDEGIFLTSCAGGARVKCHVPVLFEEKEGIAYELRIAGLLGGHSGCEIQKERGNSNCLFGRALNVLCEEVGTSLVSVQGGLADNAIPRETMGTVLIAEADACKAEALMKELGEEIARELGTKDPSAALIFTACGAKKVTAVTTEATRRLAQFICALPAGIQAMSADMPGLVETSLNLGIMILDEKELMAEFSVRSSVESAKKALIQRVNAVTELAKGYISVSGDYPGWKYRKDSPLREKMLRIYREMYKAEPKVEAIHAGLECGILGSKIDDLDCVSMGPDMRDIHTTEETLSISSTARVWEYLVKVLEEKENA